MAKWGMTSTTELRDRREAVVREHMQAENEHRWDDVMATFRPGRARYELVASGEVFEGESAVRDYWQRGRELIPDQTNELIALHHGDDTVIVEFWLRGTNTGGPNPTNRAFSARLIAVFEFDDDRIVNERAYWDRRTIEEQLGLHS